MLTASGSTRRTLLGTVLLGWITLGLAPGQPDVDDGLKEVRKIFFAGLKAPTVEERLEAVNSLLYSGLPEGIAMMEDALDQTRKHRDRLHRRYLAIGKKINDRTRNKLRVSRSAEHLAEDRAALARDLDGDERVINALLDAMGQLFTSCAPEQQTAILAPFVERLGRLRSAESRMDLLEVLGYLKGREAVAAILPLAADREAEVRLVAIEALGRQGDRLATLALAKALDDAFWQVRVVAIDALTRVGGVAAVDALIRAISRADGRVIYDINRALEALTGQNFHENEVLWRAWWKENRRSYRGPPAAGAAAPANGSGQADPEAAARKKAWMERTKGTSFYGIRTRSKRIVYVLDVSSSMNAPLGSRSPTTTGTARAAPPARRKIDQARRELKSSIAALPDDAVFGIVFYNHEVHVWRKGLVEATVENRTRAGEWADSIEAHGNTNIFDAVERAFGLAGRGTYDKGYETAADTVFLLSDGQANRGRLVDREEMRREIARMNRLKKVVIHTVALGGDADVAFMQGLAEDTGGQFKHVAGR
jgi:hypothetical protein